MNTGNLKFFIDGYANGIAVTGLSDAAIKDLQTLLNDCGYKLAVDGKAGPKTLAAWQSFKQSIYQDDPKFIELIGRGSYDALVVEAVERKTGLEPHDEPADIQGRDRGKMILMPGISNQVGLNDPIYNGSNFFWWEATKSGQRIPVNSGVTENIVKSARFMDDVRSHFGNRRIQVNSWYRDPVSNAQVGGASRSRHIEGDAVDFVIEGLGVVEVFLELKKWKPNLSMAVGSGFVHVDLRPGRAARWRYAGAHSTIPLW